MSFVGELGLDRVALAADLKDRVWQVVGGVAPAEHRPFAEPATLRRALGEVETDLVDGAAMGEHRHVGHPVGEAGPGEADASMAGPKPGVIADQEAAVLDAAGCFEALDESHGVPERAAEEPRQLVKRDCHLIGEQAQRNALLGSGIAIAAVPPPASGLCLG